MASLVVRDIPDDVVRRLEQRAAGGGRSREAEVRAILAASVSPRDDWGAFQAAAEIARGRLPSSLSSNSVDDLAAARNDRMETTA